MSTNNGKATIREVRDLVDDLKDEHIIPLIRLVEHIDTILGAHLKNYEAYCKGNNRQHRNFLTLKSIKITGIIFGFILTVFTVYNSILTFVIGK